jgi:cob(I)alamin adenosyltransferase
MDGLTHIICGFGKGKTTSAVGCALRARGSGMNVVFVSFMKDGTSSENELMKNAGITLLHCGKHFGFTFEMSQQEKQELTQLHNEMLRQALELAQRGKADMLVLDEFFCAYEYGLFDKAVADKIVFEKPHKTELILTGHNAEQKFIDAADYVTRLESEKHPYEKGVAARRGIEY